MARPQSGMSTDTKKKKKVSDTMKSTKVDGILAASAPSITESAFPLSDRVHSHAEDPLYGNFQVRKVEDFFGDLDNNSGQWSNLAELHSVVISKSSADAQNDDRMMLTLKDNNQVTRFMAIDFITADIFRLQFDPTQEDGNYTESTTRSSVQDHYMGLREALHYYAENFPNELGYTAYTNFTLERVVNNESEFTCTTKDLDSGREILRINLDKTQLHLTVCKVDTDECMWRGNLNETFFKHEITYNSPQGDGARIRDYSIALTIHKPNPAKYIGFGEKGGATLCKNNQMLSYFNFDNMRYQSMYNQGALDSREPLYHSNPFFLEFNGTPDTEAGVHGTFVNNPSQILMDICCTYQDKLRMGTCYGMMDVVVFIGDTSKEVLSKSTSIAGKARLKPRYALGYHQGGYGYEDTNAMLDVVNGYGDSDVPFDGLHVDVDVQKNYRTFTMNEDKYRRICLGKDGKVGPIEGINSNNVVILQRRDSNGNNIEAVYPDGTSVFAFRNADNDIIEAHWVDGRLVAWKNEDGSDKKVGQFLFEHLLDGHNSWAQNKNMKIKCSTNITPVVSNPFVMNNEGDGQTYRTLKSGLDGDFFVKYKKSMPDLGHDASNSGSNYSGDYLGGVYYGQDAQGTELGSFGHYPDFGKKDTRLWWGQQYKDLIKSGLSMIWQDMTTPAISINQNLQMQDESWFNFTLWNGRNNVTMGGGGANLCCSFKSFPFYLFVTDNFEKRYQRGQNANTESPACKVRNLYSYNLHKATYHGINNIWKINEMSFTWVIMPDAYSSDINKGTCLNMTQSRQVLDLLVNSNMILENASATGTTPSYTVKSSNIREDVANALRGSAFEPVTDQVCQVLFDARSLEGRANMRNFIVGRGGFSGMHRFAALWTGDNASTWDFLKINVAQMLALGMSGQPMAGADIGGFENPQYGGGNWADPELVMRWTILGAFLPWFRNHYRRKGTKEFQELYKFQDYAMQAPEDQRFLYYSILPVSRMYIKTRYQMLQLFYDAMFENTVTGMPIARPLFLQDEHDANLFNDQLNSLNNQFLVGRDLMVAPIMDKQDEMGGGHFQAKRDIYFPTNSSWYQFLHNRKALAPSVGGGTTINYDAFIDGRCCDPHSEQSLYVLPLYVREGGIIPMTQSERYVGAYYEDNGVSMPITVNIYPSPNQKETSYSMYLDDGQSRSSAQEIETQFGGDPQAKGEYRKIDISHMPAANWDRTITMKRMHDGIDPSNYNLCNYHFIAMPHDPAEPIVIDGRSDKGSMYDVQINGTSIPFFGATSDGNAIDNHFNTYGENVWYYNTALNTTYIKVYDSEELTITFKRR